MRLSDTGESKDSSYTFFWCQGKSGTGFAISHHPQTQLTELSKQISDGMITLWLAISNITYATFVSVYAPTMAGAQADIDGFYSQQRATLNNILRTDNIVVLGDLNARVGSDHNTWTRVLGENGRGNLISIGKSLLQLCKEYSLSIIITFFDTPDKHFYSWKHPGLDTGIYLIIMVSQKTMKDVYHTRVKRVADCFSDHHMIRCQIQLTIYKPKKKKSSMPL